MTGERYDLTAFADDCVRTALEIDRLRDPSLESSVTVFLETAYLALVERERSEEPPWPLSQP